jgi:Fe-S cluster assembly iron-binding protein IscA
MNLSFSQDAKNAIKEQMEKQEEKNEELAIAIYQYFTRS